MAGYNRKNAFSLSWQLYKKTEIGSELMKLKESPENDQIPLREKFHLLEDEQISLDNLFQKLQDQLNPEEKSS